MASESGQIDGEVRALQAKRQFVSIAVYKIVDEYAERIAAAGKACGQCARVHISSGNIGTVARTREPHVCGDVRSDPAYKSCFEGIRAETVMPVKSTAGKLVGIVGVETEGEIDAAEIASFANMLASLLATENEV
jgi:putative methionine-R-sulfoxide reductase with GAF domain